MRCSVLACGLLAIVLSRGDVLRAGEDIVIADFEGEDYGAWKATGEAFGPGPVRGTLPGQMKVTGFQGKGLIDTSREVGGTMGSLVVHELRSAWR